MKFAISIITLVLSVLYTQDRSLIFTTGAPLGSCLPSELPCSSNIDCLLGETCNPPLSHIIEFNGTSGTSLSDRIYINNNMVLEALKIYAQANTSPAYGRVILQADEGGLPGEEIYSWILDVEQENHGYNYFLITTTDLCIYLDEGNYYWLTLHADDIDSQISWYYSNNSTFTYTSSSDQGATWDPATIGNCGSLAVYGEYIYEPEVEDTPGDINEDGSLNVLDVVVLINVVLSGEDFPSGDINGDGENNVLDVVGLVYIIMNGATANQLSDWLYEDINTNSEFFGQMVGPEVFNGHVSLYYFGKAG